VKAHPEPRPPDGVAGDRPTWLQRAGRDAAGGARTGRATGGGGAFRHRAPRHGRGL